MSRRALLALSAIVSAFVLVLIGAVATLIIRSRPAPTAQAADSVSVDVVRQREAEYRRLLDEANARLRAHQVTATPAERLRAEVSPARDEHHVHGDDDEGHHARQRHHEHHDEDDDG